MATRTKVVEQEEVTGTKKRRERRKRPTFNLAEARNANGSPIEINAEGQLVGIPANWTNVYAPLRRNNFATRESFFEFRIALIDSRISDLHDRREELQSRAEGTFVMTPQRKMKKLQKMMRQAAELRAQLEAEGIEIEEA